MRRDQISLQLYTVREETARDMPGTLREISDIGYPAVEFAGYGGLAPGTSKPSSTTSASEPPASTFPWTPGRRTPRKSSPKWKPWTAPTPFCPPHHPNAVVTRHRLPG